MRLIGYSLEKNHRLLVYDFMPQHSLDKHLLASEFLILLVLMQSIVPLLEDHYVYEIYGISEGAEVLKFR